METEGLSKALVYYLSPNEEARATADNSRTSLDDQRATVVSEIFKRARLYEALRWLLDHQQDIPPSNYDSPLCQYIQYDMDQLQMLEAGLLAAQAVQQLRRHYSPEEPLRNALRRLGVQKVDWVPPLSVSAINPWVELLSKLPDTLHDDAPKVAQLVEILTLIDPHIPQPEFIPATNRTAVSCVFPLVQEPANHDEADATLCRFVAEVGAPARVLDDGWRRSPLIYPHPQMLLNTSFEEDFLNSVKHALEYAVKATGASNVCIRWHLRPFFSELPPIGSISGPSVGVAAAMACRRLLEGGGSLSDREVFSGGINEDSRDFRVGGIRLKSDTLSKYPELRLNTCDANEGDAPPDWISAERVRTFRTLDEAYQIATGLPRQLQAHLTECANNFNSLPFRSRERRLTIDRVFVEPRLQVRKLSPPRERPDAPQPTAERPEHARQEFSTRDYWEEAQAWLYERLPLGSEYTSEPVRWKQFVGEVRSGEEQSPSTRRVLLGAPGSGKTTATKAYARQLALTALQQMEQGVDLRELTLPLWVRLSTVAFNRRAPVEALLDAAEIPDVLRGFYRAQLQAGRVKVFLDGLDEVSEAQKLAFERWLEVLLEAVADAPMILTCRTLNWESGRQAWAQDFSKQEPYELAPLNLQELRAFVRKFYPDDSDKQHDLLQRLERSVALRHTARTYLIITLIALLHSDGQLRGDLTLAGVYRKVLKRILTGEWRMLPPDKSPAARSMREADDLINKHLLKAGYTLFIHAPNENRFAQSELMEVLGSANEQLLEQLLAVGFLVDAGDNEQGESCYSVMHRSFLEYLAGAYLAQRPPEFWEPIMRGAGEGELVASGEWGSVHRAPRGSWWWYAPEYAEALAFMASAMADATPLLEAIEAEERKYPREVFRHLLVHKARVVGYAKRILKRREAGRDEEDTERREAIVREVVRLYFEYKSPPRDYVLPALRGLGRYAVDALIQRLQDKDWWVRLVAARALGQLGDVRAVDDLIQRLQDADVWVREAAAWALGQIGDVRAVEPLIQRLQDEEEWVRAAAAEALGQIGDASAVNPLIQRLQDEDWWVRFAAARALGQIGDADAVKPLIERLQDENEDSVVRAAAAEALGQIGDASAVNPLIQRLQDENEDSVVRRAAAWALGQLGDVRAVDDLIQRLQDANADVRRAAAEALGQLGDVRAVDDLIQRLQDANADVRREAAEALGQLGDVRAVDDLIQRLQDANADVRREAAWALGQLGDVRAVDDLIQRLQDAEWRVRFAAARALGQIGDVRAVDDLIQRLQDENEDSVVRRAAAEALGQIGDVRAVNALIERLQDEDWWVRKAAAEALGRIGDVRAVNALIERLQDEEEWVRKAAAEALGRIGDARAVNPLIARLQDKYEEVCEAAWQALYRICARNRDGNRYIVQWFSS